MKRTLLMASAAIVLAGPTVLAFFAGGYFDGPRDWMGAIAWLAVVLAGVAGARLPSSRRALVVLGGLAGLAAWTLLSTLWAPVADNAYHAGQIAILYVGVLLAASMVIDRRTAPWAEVVLASGSMIVLVYALAGRLLPGLVPVSQDLLANGRLEQPITYWNALGELAAMGIVLCARISGTSNRPRWLRAAAAAAVAPLGLGLYLTFSRGALFAGAAGLVALVTLAPRREQLSAVIRAVLVVGLASATAAPFSSVTALIGTRSTQETQGLIVLGMLVLVTALAATACEVTTTRERSTRLRLPARAPLIATALIGAGLALVIAIGAGGDLGGKPLAGGPSRLTSLTSNRYDYWSVALRAFSSSPVHGVGAAGWRVWWLRARPISETAADAHSLPLQTLAELGLVGIALLSTFLIGLAVAARHAIRAGPQAVGAIGVLVVYFAHAPLDWDWQLPSVTMFALVLAGLVLALDREPLLAVTPAGATTAATGERPGRAQTDIGA